ncbi:DUF6625 family protein [Gelidibacter japonicus]|uniref:DUF6625 family protein n=1 Tax=Gelidibacter japonicus TaxID=1962232 RepID=UPI003A8DF9A6
MDSIILIIPYFGKWPVWFDAYLASIETNPTINWLCPTDCEIPKKHPENIIFLPTTLLELNKHINTMVEAKVPLNARKFCDLKPTYADIFKEHIKGYDFWGICDMDIVWGDIRKFMTPELLNEYDIICSRPEAVSGHFNLFRNIESLNIFYKSIPNYKKLFEASKLIRFDEITLTDHLKILIDKNESSFRVFWDTEIIKKGIESEKQQEYYLDRWLFEKGKIYDLYDINKKEYMYLHFINWKRTMKFSEIKWQDNPQQFYISYTGMHYKPHSAFEILLNRFKNLYNGYYTILFRKRLEKKLKKLIN